MPNQKTKKDTFVANDERQFPIKAKILEKGQLRRTKPRTEKYAQAGTGY
jgi:hypothetical protein